MLPFVPHDNSRPNSNEEASLTVIGGTPPSHVFPEEPFSIEFALNQSVGDQKPLATDAVKIEASFEQSEIAAVTTATTAMKLVLLEEPRWVETDATESNSSSNSIEGSLSCYIRYNGGGPFIPQREGAAFCIRISGKASGYTIIPAVTGTIHLVNAKLRIIPTLNWSNVFYKDQGGREKGIEVGVEACDRSGQQLFGRTIPLVLTLCYRNSPKKAVKVKDQRILRCVGVSAWRVVIDGSTGRGNISFRIEDISKNHQGQAFSVQIGADTTIFRDIGPVFTPSVFVRSKRTARRQRGVTRSEGKEKTTSKSDVSPTRTISASPPAESNVTQLTGVDTKKLSAAISGVTQWAEEVGNEIYPLKWRLLGYAQHPNGMHDYNSPYYSMTNPNPTIDRIVSKYKNSTQRNLQVLKNAVDHISRANRKRSYQGFENGGGDETTNNVTFRTPRSHGSLMPPPVPQRPYHAMSMASPQTLPFTPPPVETQLLDTCLEAQQQQQTNISISSIISPWSASVTPLSLSLAPPAQPSPSKPSSLKYPDSRLDAILGEMEVEYILAKSFKSSRTGNLLGLPAYSRSKEILGFYREASPSKIKSRTAVFVPIDKHREDFGSPDEILRAKHILNEAISSEDDAVHSLNRCSSIENLINQVLAYISKQEIGGDARGLAQQDTAPIF